MEIETVRHDYEESKDPKKEERWVKQRCLKGHKKSREMEAREARRILEDLPSV